MQEKINLNAQIKEEVKELFKENDLIDDDGKDTTKLIQIHAGKKSKPKPNLDKYDKMKEIPTSQLGIYKDDDK